MTLAVELVMATTQAFAPDVHESSRSIMLEQLVQRGIRDPRVLAAMAAVPRELFVPPRLVEHAYADRPLPLSRGQTISQPYVVAKMLEALRLDPHDRVLEIGTGSGYSAAVLSELTVHVDSIERLPTLAVSARERLAALGYATVDVHCSDGSIGWVQQAPYNAIVVTACGLRIPNALLDQLVQGGRLVMPVGDEHRQHLIRSRKIGVGQYALDDLGPVQFVPLIGSLGWPDQ